MGGFIYIVLIFKDWVMDNGVLVGSEVEFYLEGDLLFLMFCFEEECIEGIFDIVIFEGDEFMCVVMMMYVSGFDIIVLESLCIMIDQCWIICEVIQSFVGFEVFEEMCDWVVICDLFDFFEFFIYNVVIWM